MPGRESGRFVRLGLRDRLRLGTVGLRTRRLRAALSGVGIGIAIGTTIVVTGIPASSHAAVVRQLDSLGPDLLVVTGRDIGADEPVTFSPQAGAMTSRIGPVTAVGEAANTHAVVQKSAHSDDADESGITVVASRGDLLGVVRGHLAQGHDPTAGNDGLPEVVLGATSAVRLGIARLHTGDRAEQVLIGGRSFTVVGILRPLPLARELDTTVLVGWRTAHRFLAFDRRPSTVYLTADDTELDAVRAVLPATVDPQQPELVSVTRPSDALAAKRDVEGGYAGLLLGLAGVALLVGAIGVANTMVISVLERRAEIGLRRALGATRGDIRWQFVTESVLLSVLGGLVGAGVGVLVSVGWAASRGWPPVVPLPAVAGSLAAAVVVGAAAGLYPAVRAARLSPAEVLGGG